MTAMNTAIKRSVEAWKTAASELGIEVVAPFNFSVDGRKHECIAWVASFGSERGIVLVASTAPDHAVDEAVAGDAELAGYYWSVLDAKGYGTFKRESFIEALVDWGFKGPTEKRPAWLDDSTAVEALLMQTVASVAQRHAKEQGWRVEHTLVGPNVAVLPSGERIVPVNLTLHDGSKKCFEYRCDVHGEGKLLRVAGQ